MKFDQLIENNKRNIFLQKSCREWGGETREDVKVPLSTETIDKAPVLNIFENMQTPVLENDQDTDDTKINKLHVVLVTLTFLSIRNHPQF